MSSLRRKERVDITPVVGCTQGLWTLQCVKHRWTRYLLIHCSRLSIPDGTSLLPTHQHDIYITRLVHFPSMEPYRLYWWWQIRKLMFNIRLRSRNYFMNPLPVSNICIVQIFHTRSHTTPSQIYGNLSSNWDILYQSSGPQSKEHHGSFWVQCLKGAMFRRETCEILGIPSTCLCSGKKRLLTVRKRFVWNNVTEKKATKNPPFTVSHLITSFLFSHQFHSKTVDRLMYIYVSCKISTTRRLF